MIGKLRPAPLIAAALCLFACGASGSEQPNRADKENNPLTNGEFKAQLNGRYILYAVHGNGPPLMILPNSWGLTHQGLRMLFRGLEERFTLIYFDPRGMGGSDPVAVEEDMSMAAVREDLDALRQRLGLGAVPVMGWSNGGMNLLLLAAQRPQAVSAAVVVHAAASFTEEDQADIAQRYPEMLRLYAEYKKESKEWSEVERTQRQRAFYLEVWFPYLFAEPEAARRRLPDLYRDARFSWRHARYAEEVESPAYDAREALSQIQCPTLVIAGRYDMMPPSRIEEVHRGVAASRFVVFESSGHFAPIEEPEKFIKVATEFLTGVESRQEDR